ncbi:MAG: M48 family metallopeptidase [Candidatus Schekmanbacteria bacterium]|nr:M48 family metallopeptidase [Candidatus Schekmanbacteria bacterium]
MFYCKLALLLLLAIGWPISVSAAPVTGHPRLWVRAEDLPRLRAWATAANPMYQNALLPALQEAINTYDTRFFPGGQPNPTWPDPGIDNWVQYTTEAYAEFFAFWSLIDPDPAARPVHAQRALNLLMHVMNEAVKGPDPDDPQAPFRSRAFATYNRANYWGEAFGLTVDWIYPYLSAQDKETIQKVFLLWSDRCVNASTAGNEHPQPIGVTNDPQLLSDRKQLRWAMNNYFLGHQRVLTLMSLALDAEDDPPVQPGHPIDELGNTMRSYLVNAVGAWLYQTYSMFEDSSVVANELRVDPNGLGLASGGLPVEGFLYGHAMGYLHQTLLALYTAGYGDPDAIGPQAGLITSSTWDRFLAGFLHSAAPAGKTPEDPAYSYLGPLFAMANYGDLLRFWIYDDYVETLGSIGALDQATGRTDRLATLRWAATNILAGGQDRLYERAGRIWGNANASQAILYFLLFDPEAPAVTADPRLALPVSFVDQPFGRLLARTDFTPEATWFDFLCHWTTINHQHGDCGQFELYRKGEWLTKERSGYPSNAADIAMATADYHNTLSLQNDVPANLQWFEGPVSERGGQWTEGLAAGDPTVLMSTSATYAYAQADATNLYNRPNQWDPNNAAVDIQHASRAILWLKPDHVIVYDRATSLTANRFKRFNVTLTALATVEGQQATVETPNGQKLYMQNLLPPNAILTSSPAESFAVLAELEPSTSRLVIEDPANPTDVRFLNVLQGADAGSTADPATLLRAMTGTAYEGAAVRETTVLFPVDLESPFDGLAYTAPEGTTRHLITGLAPNATYDALIISGPNGVDVAITAGQTWSADAAGVLLVTTTPTPIGPVAMSSCLLGLHALLARWRLVRRRELRSTISHGRVASRSPMRPWSLAIFAVLALFLAAPEGRAQEPPAVAAVAVPTLAPIPSAAARVPLDPEAATQAYLSSVPSEVRARSDAYFEGGYWLMLVKTLVAILVNWTLLASGWSARMRDRAEHLSRRPLLQSFPYWVQYSVVTEVAAFPLLVYADFYREWQYGLATQTFAEWLLDDAKGLGVGIVLGGVLFTVLYAVLRRMERSWWLWGAAVVTTFFAFVATIGPVFIAPLFNTYAPLQTAAVRDPILQMAHANGVDTEAVYQVDASRQTTKISANVSGFMGTDRITLNDNLLKRCSLPEIRHVMGHELGHYVLNHGYEMIVTFGVIIAAGFWLVSRCFDRVRLGIGRRWGVRAVGDVAGLPLLQILVSLYFFAMTPVMSTVTRTNEQEADYFALNAAREPDAAAQVALKLADYRKLAPGPIEEIIFFDHPSGRVRILTAMKWKAATQVAAAAAASPRENSVAGVGAAGQATSAPEDK